MLHWFATPPANPNPPSFGGGRMVNHFTSKAKRKWVRNLKEILEKSVKIRESQTAELAAHCIGCVICKLNFAIITVTEYFGEFLVLHRVRRKDMGAFMCIAKNDVPPTVSKRIVLNVNCKLIHFITGFGGKISIF